MSGWWVVAGSAVLSLVAALSLRPGAGVVGRRLLLLLVILLVGASQWSAAFDGYDTDTWTYRLIVERVAHGHSMWAFDPFLLEPPPAPHVTPYWSGLGRLCRLFPEHVDVVFRLLALGAVALCSFGAWEAAGALVGKAQREGAVALFWLTSVGTWPEVMLGRNVSLGFVLLAIATVLRGRQAPRPPLALAFCIVFAFYAHPFGGLLAFLAVGLVVLSDRRTLPWRWRDRIVLVLIVAAFAAPVVIHTVMFATPDAPSNAHLHRPGVVSMDGLRALGASELFRLMPPAVLLLMLIGLSVPAEGAGRMGQRLARGGCLLALVVLFTPVYHGATAVLGGWLVERVMALAFPWTAAVLGLAFCVRVSSGPWAVPRWGAALVLTFGIVANALLVFAESFVDRPLRLMPGLEAAVRPIPRAERRDRRPRLFYRFDPEAQQEATSLRGLLAGEAYVSEPLLAYGLAAATLGRPVAVPPGHASPTSEFMRRERKVTAALEKGAAGCWAHLLQTFPDTRFLITPAPGAEVEDRLWRSRRDRTSGEATRRMLADAGLIENRMTGTFFVVDEIKRPIPAAAAGLGCGGGPE